MPETTSIFQQRVPFKRCLLHQIPEHFEKVKHWVPEEEWPSFKSRMADAVEEETAWCTENTFIYYKVKNKRVADAVALFGMGYAVEMLALLQGVFTKIDRSICMMRFRTHDGKHIEEYRSLLRKSAIRKWHQDHNAVLHIRIDKLRDKIIKNIHKARYEKNVRNR